MSDTSVTVSVDGRPLRTADLALIRSVDVSEAMNSQTQVSVVVTCNVDNASGWSSPLDSLVTPFARFQVAINRGGDSLVVPSRATSASWSIQAGALSTLTIAGLDASADLDRVERDHDLGGVSDADIATALLRPVATPQVGTTPAPDGTDRFTAHNRATDWSLLKMLATRNDFDVYLSIDDGVLTGHFDRINPLATPATTLDLGYGELGGSASVQVQLVAGQRVRIAHGTEGDGVQQIAENDGTGSAMGSQSLGGATTVLRDANDVPGTQTPEAAARALAERSAFAADMSITLTAPSMPLLRARRTVTVRGLGPLVSGLWLIKSVRHTVTPGGHTQSVALTRNALGEGGAAGGLGGALAAVAGVDMTDRFLGKFAGVVADNNDPAGLCRIDVNVPQVLSESTGWCQPALPYAGDGVGLALVPPVGASVWVEWPDGDLGKPPIWSGASFTSGNGVPGAGPNTVLLVTPSGHKVEISDDSNAITLTASGGASITLGPDGIKLDNGQGATIELAGATISLNDQSLQVS